MNRPTEIIRRKRHADKPNLVPSDVQTFRKRMHYVGLIIRELIGAHRSADPALFTRHAYLIVMSRIIEALSDEKNNLSTTELASLSKVLAEQRRLDISQMEIERRFPKVDSDPNARDGSDARSLPEDFDHIVEQIYGTNLDGSNQSGETNGPTQA
jgi:hypothetical protein